jgi:uncharacterized protein with HEPN domain
MHYIQVSPLISEFPNHPWKGNVTTRNVEAKPLYKIDKLVSIWGSFKPELSMLESCCTSQYGKGQRMFQAGADQNLEFSCNFLIL